MAAKTRDEALTIAKSFVAQEVAENLLPADAADATVRQVTTPWFRQALSYDPVPTLRKLKTPVLVLKRTTLPSALLKSYGIARMFRVIGQMYFRTHQSKSG